MTRPGTALLGRGLLADTIGATLARAGPVYRLDSAESIPDGCRAVVLSSDAWDIVGESGIRAACASRGLPWQPVRAELGRVLIGPVEPVGTPGCVQCGQSRRRLARRYPDGADAVHERYGPVLRNRGSALLTNLAADLVAALVAAEVEALAAGRQPVRTRGALLALDLTTLRVSTHRFLPVPDCPVCGSLPVDEPAAARIELRSRPKPAPDVYRVRAMARELPELRRAYLDPVSGVVHDLRRGSHGGVAVAGAALGHHSGGIETGYGRTRSHQQSELVALLEALERYGGMSPAGKRTAVHAPYREVRDRAVDPRTLGLHPQTSYELPGFPFQPFTVDRPYRWVWGYSFARDAPILVPESYAYYRTRHTDPAHPRLVYEVSNGCALGGCLEEAILFGLLEVAERDAFLLTWYARLPVPRIDLDSAADRTIPVLAAALRADTGYQVSVFDTTMEHGVASVWAMAVDPDGDGRRPKAVCAAAAHLEPERAAESALTELGPILAHVLETYPQHRARARRMTRDPALVTSMEDHSLLYADETVFHRLAFLTGSPRVRSFAQWGHPAGTGRADLRDDVRALVDRYLAGGLDVVVVDQTAPEHGAAGLACVKVIVPGLLPMTFGHRYRRIDGLPRLREVPRLLGYRDRPLPPDEINPHPHPFP